MNQYDVVVSLDDLRELKRKMQDGILQLESACKGCYAKIDETREVFNTPTGEIFREKANENVLKSQECISGKLMPFVSLLDNIIATYEESINETAKSVGK